MILLDTSVLSLALRRDEPARAERKIIATLHRMIVEDVPLRLPGIVLQELLSGVKREEQFMQLAQLLEGFPIVLAERADHQLAAKVFNACRRKGISPSSVDCLIAALAISRDAVLWTLDRDFVAIAKSSELKLFHA